MRCGAALGAQRPVLRPPSLRRAHSQPPARRRKRLQLTRCCLARAIASSQLATSAISLCCNPASFQPPTASTASPAHMTLEAASALACRVSGGGWAPGRAGGPKKNQPCVQVQTGSNWAGLGEAGGQGKRAHCDGEGLEPRAWVNPLFCQLLGGACDNQKEGGGNGQVNRPGGNLGDATCARAGSQACAARLATSDRMPSTSPV